jgi:small ligand-binding sensory domain FIST
MAFAAASSEHPRAPDSVGEVVGELLERIGPAPDLAVLFASGAHTGAIPEIADAVRRLLLPRRLIGTTAVSVVSGPREIEDRTALSLWAGHLGDTRALRLDVIRGADQWVVTGIPPDLPGQHHPTGSPPPAGDRTPSLDQPALLLLADPFTFPADAVLADLARTHPHLRVVGGLASAARSPGQNAMVLDGEVHRDGAVAVLFAPGSQVDAVVSQGCRPIGEPFTVTDVDHNLLLGLGSRPALDRLREQVEQLGPDERELAQGGLHVGVVIDERRVDFGPGDFLVRTLVGIDPERRGVAIGDLVEVGATVQFQVRDAASADAELRTMLAGRDAEGALQFKCNGRGERFFGEPHHDAALVDRIVGGPTAGMFCAGEIGPVGGRNFLHGYTASVALFGASEGAG